MSSVSDMSAVEGGRILVTAGPSISAAEVRVHVPGAEVVAPIRFGDSYRYGLVAGDTLVVVDGLFWQSASVRHRELLDLLDAGVEVYGCSSMGALRAAELAELGMVGHGEVFEAYRSALITGDDEVGMVHGLAEDDYTVGVDALVNVRATLREAREQGLVAQQVADDVIAVATRRCFTDRSWGALLRAADVPDRHRLLAWLRARPVDVKRADAASLLALVATGAGAAAIARAGANPAGPRPAPGASGYSSAWSWNRTRLTDAHASAGDVLEMAAVLQDGFAEWRHERMVRQLAAAEIDDDRPPRRDDRGREPAGRTEDSATRRPSGLPDAPWSQWCAREATLAAHPGEDLVVLTAGSLCRTGIVATPQSSLPVELEQQWVYGGERDLPTVERNALVATRTTAVDRNAHLSRPLLADLALEGRVPGLAATVDRVRTEFAEKAPGYTGALSEKGWDVVRGRLAAFWDEDYDQALRRRGLRELPELGIMFALVDLT